MWRITVRNQRTKLLLVTKSSQPQWLFKHSITKFSLKTNDNDYYQISKHSRSDRDYIFRYTATEKLQWDLLYMSNGMKTYSLDLHGIYSICQMVSSIRKTIMKLVLFFLLLYFDCKTSTEILVLQLLIVLAVILTQARIASRHSL